MDGKVVGAVVGSVVAEGSVVEEGAVLGVVDAVVEVLAKEQRTVQLLLTLPQVTVMVAVPAGNGCDLAVRAHGSHIRVGRNEGHGVRGVCRSGDSADLPGSAQPVQGHGAVRQHQIGAGQRFHGGLRGGLGGGTQTDIGRNLRGKLPQAQISAKAHDCNGQHHDDGHQTAVPFRDSEERAALGGFLLGSGSGLFSGAGVTGQRASG